MALIVSIDGNIGVGKSTVLDQLESMGYRVFREELSEWYVDLEAFYRRPAVHAYALQQSILASLSRRLQCIDALRCDQPIVFMERSPLSNLAFSRVAYLIGFISLYQLKLLEAKVSRLVDEYKWVDILLTVDPTVSLQRIHRRQRACEQSITRDYLSAIATAYEAVFKSRPVHRVDANQPITAVLNAILTRIGFKQLERVCKMPKIAAVSLVKNESARISVTARSLDKLDGWIILDTGSEDDTLDIIQREKPDHVPVHIKKINDHVIDFAHFWNTLLDWADTCADEFDYEYFVMLDANDEFRGDPPSSDKLASLSAEAEAKGGEFLAGYVERKWKYTQTDVLAFWNARFVRAHSKCRYVGRIHEYLDGLGNCRLPIESFHIFQDRTLDDDKSSKRFHNDRLVLEEEYEKDPTNMRTLFYLAQTYEVLGEYPLAYNRYAERALAAVSSGYSEEKFTAMVRCGQLAEKLKMDWSTSLNWYSKAVAFDTRVEPLLALAAHYLDEKAYGLAYGYICLACALPYPTGRWLWVEETDYNYRRWHLLGIVAFYAAPRMVDPKAVMEQGELGCTKAIEVGHNRSLDESNLAFYLV